MTGSSRLRATALAFLIVSACSSNTGVSGPQATPDTGSPDVGIEGIDAGSDAGCTVPCGSTFCCDGYVCNAGACCKPNCDGKSCGDNGCGGSCGDCDKGWTCNESSNTCECTPQTDEELCDALSKPCGALSAKDNCGVDRSVACDRCVAPETCDVVAEECRCVRQTESEFCLAHSSTCGTTLGVDNCGASWQVECGTCDVGLDCVNHACTCVPETPAQFCNRVHAQCGSVTAPDNCSQPRTVDCGGCIAPNVCDATNQCACAGETDGAFCLRLNHACGALTGIDNCNRAKSVTSCGHCPPSANCDSNGQCIAVCVPESDTDFCTRLNMNCGQVTANDNCGAPRTVASCGTCTAPDVCDISTNVCGTPGVPTNDDCTAPAALNFVTVSPTLQTATFRVDTSLATNSGDAACNYASGKDVVYTFTTITMLDFSATSTPLAGSSAEPNLYLRAACSTGPEIACKAVSSVMPVQIDAEALAAGTYYLWVDGWAASIGNGPQEVVVTLSSPPPPPANDLCVAAETLNFTGNIATASGTTRGAADDGTGSCGTMTGGDVFYVMDLIRDSAVTIKVTPGSTSLTFAPAVWVTDACTGGTQSLCATASPGATVIASSLNLTAGIYYVVVDSTAAKRGDFTLEVTTDTPITNDNCNAPNTAQPAPLDPTTLTGSVSSDTTAAANDYSPSCYSSGGRDLVFSFDVPPGVNKNATVTVTPASGSPINPVVAIATACTGGTELACVSNYSGGAQTVQARRLSPGTYFVWVDGYGSNTNGPFTLDIALADVPPAPPNDLCSAPTTVPISAGVGSIPGTTVNATNDSTGACGTMNGPDVVFTFEARTASSVLAVVTRDAASSTFQPAVYIRPDTTCGSGTTTENACGTTSGGSSGTAGIASATAANLPAGWYLVIVDGLNNTEGDFTLDLRVGDPLTNDTCSGAAAITVDPLTGSATMWGDTRGMTNDITMSSTCTSTPALDTIYSITLPHRQNLAVDIAPLFGSQARHTIMVRSDCNDTTTNERACKAASAGGASASLIVPQLAGATYYIIVDGWLSYDNGPYQLTVTATDPLPPPNDVCRTATGLALDPTTGSVTVTGTTVDAAGDGSGSCRTGTTDPSGGDVVYQFTTLAENRIQVDVTPLPGSTLRPVVFLRHTTCDTATTESACTAGSSTTSTATVIVPFAPADTYYVWVDSYSPLEMGTFTLTVSAIAPPTPPSNDNCRGTPYTELTWDSANNKFTGTGTTSTARDDYAGICSTTSAPQNGGDVVFSFTTTADYKATVTITPSSSPNYIPAFYIRSVCDSTVPSDNLGCASATWAGTFTSTVGYLPAGTYYLIVDGVSGTFGDFSVQMVMATPVPGDSCVAAVSETIVPGTPLVVTGTTSGAVNDSTSLNCGGTDAGPDVVYTFSTVGLGQQLFEASFAYTSTSGYPTLSLRKTVCNSSNVADEVGCTRRGSWGANVGLSSLLQEGVYYLWVDDQYSYYYGAFSLTLKLTAIQPPPMNDVCARADTTLGDLTTAQSVTLTGSTNWAVDDYQAASCNGATSGGGDTVYMFTLTADTQLQVTANRATGNATYNPTIYLRKTNCSDQTAASQVTCASSSSGSATLKAYVLTAGTYYLIVDAQSGGNGDYSVNVVSSAPRYYPDNCASAKTLVFNAAGHAALRDDTTDASLDAAPPTCVTVGGSSVTVSGPDLVYVVDTTTLGARDFVATVQYDGYSVYPQLYLRTVCDSALATDQLGCVQRYASGGQPLTLGIANLPAGVYYLWVDVNYSTDRGPFNLTVDLLPPPPAVPPNDSCTSAATLAFDPTGLASASGATIGGTNDSTGSCGTMDGADVVYSFTLRNPANVQVKVAQSALSPSYQPAVHIRSTCASTGSTDELACGVNSSGVATAIANNLTATTYYVIVDGTNGTSGEFMLSATMLGSTTNDCTQMPALVFDPATGVATVRGDTSVSTNRTSNSCNYSWSDGKDIGFQLTVPPGGNNDITVVLTPATGSTYEPSVSIRSSCTGTEATDKPTELANSCGYNSSTSPLTVTVPGVAPGTYYLLVDTYSTYAGAFLLSVTMVPSPPPPPNDTCTGAGVTLNFTGTNAQTTGQEVYTALNDTTGSCGTMSGPDVVYTFTTRQDQLAVFTITSHGHYAPSFYLRSNCSSTAAADEVFCSTSTSTAVSLVATRFNLPSGTYYLWVDSGASNTVGTYDLSIDLAAPNCGDAIALTQGVSTNGDTTNRLNMFNTANSCPSGGYGFAGHDAYFTYTPANSGPFTVAAYVPGTTTDLNWDGVVWVATACDPTTCVARGDDPERVTYSGGVAGQTYYIILDGYSASAMGPFDIQVIP